MSGHRWSTMIWVIVSSQESRWCQSETQQDPIHLEIPFFKSETYGFLILRLPVK